MSRLEEVKEKIKEINQQNNALYQELSDLESELLRLKFEEMISGGVLNEFSWETDYNFKKLVLYSNVRKHKKLADLFETDFHCRADFDDWMLYFNDGEIEIVFKDFDKGLDFIKKNNIKIELKKIEENLNRANEEVYKISTFIKRLGK